MRGEFVDIGSGRLYYYAAGRRQSSTGAAGVPVVLIHGFPTSSRLWHLVARDFPDGHRLIVVDLPGFGRSDSLPLPATPTTPPIPICARFAGSVRSLMDALGVASAAIVGHGLGGGVAQALAVESPGRVSHLALVSSHAFGVTPRRMTRLARALEPASRLAPAGLLAGLVHGAARRGFADPSRAHHSLDSCLRPFCSPAGRATLARLIAETGRCGTDIISPRLRTSAMPAAVIWGQDDPFLPLALGVRLAGEIPGATFEALPGAQHFVPEDTPDQLIRAIVRLLER
jgi:pimeloyl-ACP methyl ester carboxylesterase